MAKVIQPDRDAAARVKGGWTHDDIAEVIAAHREASTAQLLAERKLLVEALRPFVDLLDTAERHDWLDEAGFTLMHHHKFVGSVKLATLRAARQVLTRIQGQGEYTCGGGE